MRTFIVTTAIAISSLTFAGSPVYAWNLVCGISVNMDQQENNRKWDADSSSLYGVSHFYAAVAELQRIQLNEDKTFNNPTSNVSDKTVVEQASIELKNSVDSFTKGLKLAEQYNLGDEKGLSLLKSLVDGTTSLYDTIEYQRTLPELSEIQEVAKNINEFTAYGMELSEKHLNMGMKGHGTGGSDYKIPD